MPTTRTLSALGGLTALLLLAPATALANGVLPVIIDTCDAYKISNNKSSSVYDALGTYVIVDSAGVVATGEDVPVLTTHISSCIGLVDVDVTSAVLDGLLSDELFITVGLCGTNASSCSLGSETIIATEFEPVDTVLGDVIASIGAITDDLAAQLAQEIIDRQDGDAAIDADLTQEILDRTAQDAALEALILANSLDIGLNAGDILANAVAIAANASGVATNASGVATNASGVATNSADIAGVASGVATNSADIATNAGGIAANASGVATNSADIAANASGVATNASGVAANASGVAANASGVATNSADIAGLASGVATNSADIATNASGVAANASGVATNSADIAGLASGVATNSADIATNASGVAANASGVATNASGVATNASGVATNSADIATNASGVAANASGVAANASGVATNASAIATNSSDILTVASDVASNAAAIAANTSAIAANTSGIATNTSGIATNASGIATNTSGIATNASGIATNTSGIATNASGIATNASGIATNASGIATNAAGVAVNNSGIAALQANKQDRVVGTCPAGSSIRVINASGGVVCEVDNDANTTYSAGTGLTLGGTTFSIDTSTTQARVAGTCPPGSSIRAINPAGGVLCETDDGGGSVTAGAGLDLTSGVLSIDAGGVATSMLANGAVTDAKIASVSASKVTAGTFSGANYNVGGTWRRTSCPAGYSATGGTNGNQCWSGWRSPKTRQDAQRDCFDEGASMCTYDELYHAWASGDSPLFLTNDAIGDRVGDDEVLCVNNTTDIANFDGLCNKNDSLWYRCCMGEGR